MEGRKRHAGPTARLPSAVLEYFCFPKIKCLKNEFATRYCGLKGDGQHALVNRVSTAGILTCHANGRFFRFARSSKMAMIRLVLPLPVKVLTRTALTLVRDRLRPRPRAATAAIFPTGRRAMEAIAAQNRVIRKRQDTVV